MTEDAGGRWWPGLAPALAQVDGLDRVELKALVAAEQHESVVAGVRRGRGRIRSARVYFVDTPGLGLRERGVIVRARRRPGGSDVVVKLRRSPTATAMVEGPATAAVELDALPGAVWCATSLRCRVRPSVIRGAVRGHTPVVDLLSAGQRTLLDQHGDDALATSAGCVEVDDLVVAGPITVIRAAVMLPDPAPRAVLEEWVYPDGTRLVELSTKCRPSEAFRTATRLGAALGRLGLVPDGDQTTKTEASLKFFFCMVDAPGENAHQQRTSSGVPGPTP